ncbi:MAG: type II secretion system protein [Myxococcota bacterium]
METNQARQSSPEDPIVLDLRDLLARRRRRRRGVTLVEVLIVVAIMALIAGGVGVLVLPKYRESQEKQARLDAGNIRGAVTTFIALKGGDCPTVETLIAEKEIDGENGGRDPWGGLYTIECDGDDIIVSSAGQDQQEGTEDDIVVGAGSAEG